MIFDRIYFTYLYLLLWVAKHGSHRTLFCSNAMRSFVFSMLVQKTNLETGNEDSSDGMVVLFW